jgi:hypothetical protein
MRISRRVLITLLLLVGLVPAAPAVAAPATVTQQHFDVDNTFESPNFCGWPSSFHEFGEVHYTVVELSDGRFHIAFQEAINWILVISNDPSVPPAAQGLTWRGRNDFVYVDNLDPSSSHEVFHTVQVSSEGPFHGLRERLTLVVGADGTVHVDRFFSDFVRDCDAILTGG